jgi:hypothetical protein
MDNYSELPEPQFEATTVAEGTISVGHEPVDIETDVQHRALGFYVSIDGDETVDRRIGFGTYRPPYDDTSEGPYPPPFIARFQLDDDGPSPIEVEFTISHATDRKNERR